MSLLEMMGEEVIAEERLEEYFADLYKVTCVSERSGSSERHVAAVRTTYIVDWEQLVHLLEDYTLFGEDIVEVTSIRGEDARMLPVAERRRFLLGANSDEPVRARQAQQMLFSDGELPFARGPIQPASTKLDRLHQAMLLFAEERGDDLKRLLIDDGIGADQRFWTLANALSALYPKNSRERRWVEGLLARKRMLVV